jgi:putative polyhydroxyalkanoate system protein
MPNIHLKHRHSLSKNETRKRVDAVARDLKKEYKMEYAWEGDSVRFKRSGASGLLALGEDFVEVDIKLGMLLAPLKGKIEDTLRRDIETKLA